ncbi:phosphoglucosamine mutase [Halorientalis salina]|uniref:phosphoglucosamine mutase n=1 Tax=Halorientalis salina TaxID=2932266 RepID=UPI0010AB9FEA|nr:phosphoglucosamine mutase [Halorientalis salina]
MEIFGSSGVRGVANEYLNPEFVCQIAQAAGSVWNTDRAAIARDTRATGQMLANAASSGLASVGCDVDRLGVVPTPGLQAYCEAEGVPGLMVTASHNPPAYNGVKLVGSSGVELSLGTLERVEERLLSEDYATVAWHETGAETRVENARRRYLDQILTAVDRDRIAEGDLTVALDPGHGAGVLTSPEFFRELGCDVVTVNAQQDGHFPGRDPEPIAENLADLGRLVRVTDADVGIAHDGDADRAMFFDERGEFVEGDAALAALAAAELDAGDVAVSAVNVSQRLVDVADEAGAELSLTPIGSTNIMTRIRDLQAEGRTVPIAGEGNGGIIFPDYRVTRDGAFTAARFLELLAETPASEVIAPYDDYHLLRMDIEYEDDAERRALLDAAERVATEAGATLDTTDGYRLDYGDSWVLARPSGTEPVVRIYAESSDPGRAADLADEMHEAMTEAKATA